MVDATRRRSRRRAGPERALGVLLLHLLVGLLGLGARVDLAVGGRLGSGGVVGGAVRVRLGLRLGVRVGRATGRRRTGRGVASLRPSRRGWCIGAGRTARVLGSGGLVLLRRLDCSSGGRYPLSPFATLPVMSSVSRRVPVVAVVGPTAAGKTALSLDLAERLGGEIVNTDAMQVYRGMDIGTAKLAVEERRGIPHHLLDLLDVTQTATVAEFQSMARAVIDDCRSRGVVPVLVGGSALYTRAVLDRFEFPGTDPGLRAEHRARAGRDGPGRPARAAADARPGDGVEGATDQHPPGGAGAGGHRLDRRTVHGVAARAELRVRRRGAGRRAHPAARPRRADRPAGPRGCGTRASSRRCAGSPITACARAAPRTVLSATGRCSPTSTDTLSEQEAFEQTVTGTRRFASRQDAWFGKDPRIAWVDWDDPRLVERAVEVCRPG